MMWLYVVQGYGGGCEWSFGMRIEGVLQTWI